MKKKIHFIICLLLFTQLGFGQKALSEKMAITAMDSLYKDARFTNKEKGPQWTYDMGVVLEGMVEVWRNTGDKAYFDYVQGWMDAFVTEDGDIRNYRPEEYNIDHIKNGRSLLLLYKVTGQEKYLKASEQVYNQLLTHPRTNEGGFWHKKIYPNQMWLDGLYMAQPFYTEYAALMGIDSIFDDVVNQFTYMENHARDEKTGLLYHGWDESRQEAWADPETGVSKHFWGRGMGWYVMALVDVLDYFPETHTGREKLIKILDRTLSAVVKYQDTKTGVWYDILDLGMREGNYVEASASSMFVYALAKAVRKGYVPKKDYQEHIDKGYAGLVEQFITPNGPDRVNINHVVTVSGLGGSPKYRDGSFEYYMSEPVKPNDPKGVGPFISAASEVEFARSAKRKSARVMLDNYYNNEYKKAPDGQLKPYHYLWDGQDNNGFSLLGRIFEQYGGILSTMREAPTKQKLADSDIYIIVDPDTEKETESPNDMNEADADEIASWVHAGGVLVLLLNDAGNCEITKFNTLPQKFGIRFNEDNRNMVKGDNYEEGAIVIPPSTGIFKKTKKIYVKEISTINVIKPAKAVVQDQGDVIIATAKHGQGTVFAIGDPWLYNEYVDGRKLPAEYQNFEAAHELVQWLVKKGKLSSSTFGQEVIKDSLAEKLLVYQLPNGGWGKQLVDKKAVNYTRPLTEALLRKIRATDENHATIDNGATTREIKMLVEAYTKTQNPNYLQAARKGVEYLLEAQYENGGFPQYYPNKSLYRGQITYNDNAMINALTILDNVAKEADGFAVFTDEQLKKRAADAVERGVDCILKTQVKQGDSLSIWAAQYNEETFQPEQARNYEPASLTASESVNIVRFLMKQPVTAGIQEAIESAIGWLEVHDIEGYRFDRVKHPKTGKTVRDLVPDNTSVLWSRFYDIKNNKPLFGDRDESVTYDFSAISDERKNGYAWFGTWPIKLLEEDYPKWKKSKEKEY